MESLAHPGTGTICDVGESTAIIFARFKHHGQWVKWLLTKPGSNPAASIFFKQNNYLLSVVYKIKIEKK